MAVWDMPRAAVRPHMYNTTPHYRTHTKRVFFYQINRKVGEGTCSEVQLGQADRGLFIHPSHLHLFLAARGLRLIFLDLSLFFFGASGLACMCRP